MIEIHIAGAGAGKTYGLAKSLIDHIKICTNHKKTFALTYTNSATTKIEQEVIKQYGSIPSNLYIQTVHSFLLNEIIFPFSSFSLGDIYNEASIISLPTNIKLKNWHIAQLKNENIIHTERVYNIAKQIIDETVSKHNTKSKKNKINRLLAILSECFEKIFIDEVQDLDDDALRFFEILGKNKINVYMIGDPKQAIKYPNSLDTFIRKMSSEQNSNIANINNITRRVPKEILTISNNFCPANQKQESFSEIVGELMYIESNDTKYDEILNEYINENQIVCIDKKSGRYSTSFTYKYCIPHDIEDMIRYSNHRKDKDLFLKAALIDLTEDILKHGGEKASSYFIMRHSLKLNTPQTAQFKDLCRKYTASDVQFTIRSIDSVKGLEAETCVIILSPNLIKYLFTDSLPNEYHFNKEWKRMYVALTRAKKRLVFALDHELLERVDIISVRESIEALGFKYHY
ncbi:MULTISPECIES: UvrD-helicase domain-containing protein [Yersinia]|uniref:UvrD-helicase domain-containing protein n=1 Tax=Yersinia TaxID=629 RepID=UPI0029AFED64|nr:DEAD/DEAH box helicase [Yersinia enterocolitica]